MSKFFKISDPASVPALQPALFGGTSEADNFPPVVRTSHEIRQFLNKAGPDNPIGIDLEFNASRPTIIGLSCGPHTGAVTWDPALCRYALDLARDRKTRLVAHAAVDADKQEVERALGIETPLDLWECSMTTHYMTNAHFCKAPNKTEDKEETGSLGLMNLWVAASMHTLWPNWKDCRGSACSGYLCPTHDPIGYCALDSLAGLEVWRGTRARMTALGIPERAYREHLELNELCRLMSVQGVKIDMRYVRDDLEREIEARKEELFPEEGRAFNPKSPKQALEYFAGLGVVLKSNSKDDVHKALVAEARKKDIELKGIEDPADIADDVVRALWSLFEYKSSGKGLTSWFDDRYLGQKTYEGRKLVSAYVHPRFITVGTATMRLSSARPNFQNVPARGFGELVRKAVIPYEPNHRIIKADFSQLELRKVLHAAGNERPVARDAFTDLVDRSEGQFERAASLYTPVKYAENSRDACRDIAKSVSHACITGDHEVLTPDGWIPIKEYKNQPIAECEWEFGPSFSPRITFRHPRHYHKYDTDTTKAQKLVRLWGRGLSQVVTTNHELPVVTTGTWQSRKYCNLSRQPVTEMFKSGGIPTVGILNPDQVDNRAYTDADIRREVAIQADGSFSYHYPDGQVKVVFHIVRPRKRDRLAKIFGIEPKRCGCKIHTGYNLTWVYRPRLLNDKKQFTKELLTLSPRQRQVFLDELLYWDGSIKKSSKTYSNTDETSITWVQIIAHLTGKQALVRQQPLRAGRKPQYSVYFNRRKYADIGSLEYTEVNIPEGEPVYCFTTSSGYFLVRHQNRISITGNSNYGEGLDLLSSKDVDNPRIKAEEDAGARLIFRDWEAYGYVVSFTGANLAQRLFGDKSRESRKKALQIQQMYMTTMPEIPRWQRRVTEFIQDHGYVQTSWGTVMILNQDPRDNIKAALAVIGQGEGAIFVHEKMLRLWRELGLVPMMQVHDEVVYSVPEDRVVSMARDIGHLLEEPSTRFPGFSNPVKVLVGQTWLEKEMTKVTL